MSLCPRCGKVRITISSRDEMVSSSKVTYTQTVCPDPECQKIVETNFKNEEKRRAVLKDEQEKRVLQRLADKKI